MKKLTKITEGRVKLLHSPFYWLEMIRHSLTRLISNGDTQITQTDLAKKLNVSKSNVSIFLSGDGDFKMSSLMNLSIAAGYVPIVMWMKITDVVKLENSGHSLLHKETCTADEYISMVTPRDELKEWSHVISMAALFTECRFNTGKPFALFSKHDWETAAIVPQENLKHILTSGERTGTHG